MTRSKPQNLAQLADFLAMTLPADAILPRSGAARGIRAGNETLRALTRAVRAGEAAAFARFYDLYGPGVYKHLLVLAQGDELAAREVLQIVAIKLAKKIEVFDDERRLRGWLQRVAHNAFIDFCRSRQRDTRHVPVEALELPAPPDDASRQRLSESLRLALAECSPEEREILQSIYVDGHAVGDVAARCGQTYKALESRLARLRQKVRQQLLAHLRHE